MNTRKCEKCSKDYQYYRGNSRYCRPCQRKKDYDKEFGTPEERAKFKKLRRAMR